MGRPKGKKDTKPRSTQARRMAVRAGVASVDDQVKVLAEDEAAGKLSPLTYMLRVMRDESALPARRDWAANAAAPYCHPKLASVEHKPAGEDGVFEFRIRRVD